MSELENKKMEFNSQICTTIEQSKRLLDLGLSEHTADMLWIPRLSARPVAGSPSENIIDKANAIPAWSLHRLWALDRIRAITLDTENEVATLYDVVINNIEERIKAGNFNSKYLCEKLNSGD